MQLHLDFPVFALSHLPRHHLLLLGGGGGPSKSGIPNGIKIVRIPGMEVVGFLETAGEAVMTLSSYDDKTDCLVVAGVNDRCWLLELQALDSSDSAKVETTKEVTTKEETTMSPTTMTAISPISPSSPSSTSSTTSSHFKLALLRSLQADASADNDGYIRVARFSPSGRSFWCGGSEGVAREWGVPEMRLLARVESDESFEVLDVDEGAVVFEGGKKTHLSLPFERLNPLPEKNVSSQPSPLPGYSFKFVRKIPSGFLVIENPERRQDQKSKKSSLSAPRLSFLDATGKRIQSLSLSPARKNCTCLHLGAEFISLGFADGSLLVLSRSDPQCKFLWLPSAHALPITGLVIDEAHRLLYSVSADGVLKGSRLWLQGRKPVNVVALSLKVAFLVLLMALIVGMSWQSKELAAEVDDEQADFDSFYSVVSTEV